MKVCILVTIPNEEYFENCTLVFKTLRVGFPTAQVDVMLNPTTFGLTERFIDLLPLDMKLWRLEQPIHHADWIRSKIETHDGYTPLIILDADVQFYKSCEDWKFPEWVDMAGYYVPGMFNDWAQCESLARLHTSFLWFPDTNRLKKIIRETYPLAFEPKGEYCPCDPFMPAVRFIGGKPLFWDTCANLYQMLRHTWTFENKEMDHYVHLNSASFVEEMCGRFNAATAKDFRLFHKLAPHSPDMLKALSWHLTETYYKKKALEARVIKPIV